MMTNDPNRLLMIIKDRHVLVDRLGKALIESKSDNAGDAFKINAVLKLQKERLSELEKHLRSLIADRKMLDAIHAKNAAKHEIAEIARLRIQINAWENL
jgi:hypothetical protein